MGDGYLTSVSWESMAEIETEREMSRAEVAAYFHEFADKLGGGRTGGETSQEETTDGEFIEASDDEADDRESTSDDTEEEHGGKVTLTVGNESATVNPPNTVEFGMAVDSTSGMLESSERETVEFALRWDTEATDDDSGLSIQ
jgi:hypothetical protein